MLVILPGLTADADRFRTCESLARETWPEAHVVMPDYVSRFRGVRGVGRWLERWARHFMPRDGPVFILAYLLGGAALAYAPSVQSRARKIAVVRSRYQEALPRWLRRRFTPVGAALFFGKSAADLGRGFWPANFRPACPCLTLLETLPTNLVARLKLEPLDDEQLQISHYKELAIPHSAAYDSRQLMEIATEWFKSADV